MLIRLLSQATVVVVSLVGFLAPLSGISGSIRVVMTRPTTIVRGCLVERRGSSARVEGWRDQSSARVPEDQRALTHSCTAANPVIRTINTGLNFAANLAVDAKADLAFVGGYTSTNVLNLHTGRIVRTVHTSGLLAVDGSRERLIIARGDGSSPAGKAALSVITTTTGALVRRTTIGAYPSALAVAVTTGRAFLLTIGSGHPVGVSVLDTATGAVVRSVRLGAALPLETTSASAAPPSIVVVEKTGRIFVTDTHAVYMLDARSGAILRTINATDATLALDEHTGHLFVLSNPNGTGALTVSVLNAATGARVRVLHTSIKDLAFHVKIDAVVVNEAAQRLFIASEGGYDSCAALVVDTTTGAVRSAINEGSVPVAMALDSRLNRVFIAHQNLWNSYDHTPRSAGSVGLLNAMTGAVLQTVQVGWLPWVMTLDTTSRRLFVLNGEGSGNDGAQSTLSVLSENALLQHQVSRYPRL